MLLEGILIHKQAYKERDLIASFLLRSGEVISGYLYGGQGGGKHKKSNLVQIGYALKFNISERKKQQYKISEWSILWQHEKIRNDFKAFNLMNYFCELHRRLAPEVVELSEMNSTQSEELFSSLSNALYWLDEYPTRRQDIKKVMLAKLIYFLGILPDAKDCSFCGNSLLKQKSFLFWDEGQASCRNCLPDEGSHLGAWVEAGFINTMIGVLNVKFQESLSSKEILSVIDENSIEKYLWHHFQLKKESFKSLSWQN